MSQDIKPNPGLRASCAHFSESTQAYVKNLIDAFESSKAESEARISSLNDKPASRLAAVLVLLFERQDHLRVLLTTRAKQLRTNGGETSLPGGKMEEEDENIIATAIREANEEVGLPIRSPHVHILGTLDFSPFHSLIVTPVVALLTDNAILDDLKAGEGEVEHMFSYPLEAILDPELAPGLDTLVDHGGPHWPYDPAYHHHIDCAVEALGGVAYRVHCYQTSASPITGMTSDILIQAAEITYRRQPQFERYAADQLRTYEAIVEEYEANKKRTDAAMALADNHNP